MRVPAERIAPRLPLSFGLSDWCRELGAIALVWMRVVPRLAQLSWFVLSLLALIALNTIRRTFGHAGTLR